MSKLVAWHKVFQRKTPCFTRESSYYFQRVLAIAGLTQWLLSLYLVGAA